MKSVAELSPQDLDQYPVRTWAEADDESLVEPVVVLRELPDDHDSLFVACDFETNAGARLTGFVAVGMSNQQVYMIGIAADDRRFVDYRLQAELKGLRLSDALSVALGLSEDELFPLTYNTSDNFSNGTPLVGQVEANR